MNGAQEGSHSRDDIPMGSDRSFGIVFGLVFLIVCLFPLISGELPRLWASAVSALFFMLTLWRPSVLHPLNRCWFYFGLLLQRLTNPIILGLIFFLVITPIGLLMRISGRQFLKRSFDPGAASYWQEREPPGPDPNNMNRQF